MILFECDNPKCAKRVRVRHGYSSLPDAHFVMHTLRDGKLVKMGETDPTYPVEDVTRDSYPRIVAVHSRLPEGWLWGFHHYDLRRLDLLTFCSENCLREGLSLPAPSTEHEDPGA